MPTLSGDVSRILLFLKAVWYGRHGEILPEFLLTVKNLSFAPGGPITTVVLGLSTLLCVQRRDTRGTMVGTFAFANRLRSFTAQGGIFAAPVISVKRPPSPPRRKR